MRYRRWGGGEAPPKRRRRSRARGGRAPTGVFAGGADCVHTRVRLERLGHPRGGRAGLTDVRVEVVAVRAVVVRRQRVASQSVLRGIRRPSLRRRILARRSTSSASRAGRGRGGLSGDGGGRWWDVESLGGATQRNPTSAKRSCAPALRRVPTPMTVTSASAQLAPIMMRDVAGSGAGSGDDVHSDTFPTKSTRPSGEAAIRETRDEARADEGNRLPPYRSSRPALVGDDSPTGSSKTYCPSRHPFPFVREREPLRSVGTELLRCERIDTVRRPQAEFVSHCSGLLPIFVTAGHDPRVSAVPVLASRHLRPVDARIANLLKHGRSCQPKLPPATNAIPRWTPAAGSDSVTKPTSPLSPYIGGESTLDCAEPETATDRPTGVWYRRWHGAS